MLVNLFEELTTSSSSTSGSSISAQGGCANLGSWPLLIGILLIFAVLLVPSLLRNKKEKKAYEEKMSSIAVGSKVKTIGLIVGEIVAINGDQVTLRTGTEDFYSFVTVEKRAIYEVIPAEAASSDFAEEDSENLSAEEPVQTEESENQD